MWPVPATHLQCSKWLRSVTVLVADCGTCNTALATKACCKCSCQLETPLLPCCRMFVHVSRLIFLLTFDVIYFGPVPPPDTSQLSFGIASFIWHCTGLFVAILPRNFRSKWPRSASKLMTKSCIRPVTLCPAIPVAPGSTAYQCVAHVTWCLVHNCRCTDNLMLTP